MISKQKKPVEKPKKSVEKPKKSVEKPKKSVEKPKKPVEKPKKPVEKPKKSVEKPKKPVEKPKKPVEKPKKSVEKPNKSVEKPNKSVEKPNKSVLKKRVKNVNVDKIVKIIKKCIIKCGFKNPKLKGGGLTDMFNKITSKVSKNEGDGECFKNLKNIDEIFKSIHMDVVNARTNLLKYLKGKRTEPNKDLFDKLLSKYTFMVDDDDNSLFHSYKYKTINVDFQINDIDEITIENYLIVYIIDIVERLERFREGMLLCVRHKLKDEKDNAEFKKYNDGKKGLFKHKKNNAEDDDEDDDTSATMPQSTPAPSATMPQSTPAPSDTIPQRTPAPSATISQSTAAPSATISQSTAAPVDEEVFVDALQEQVEGSPLIPPPLRANSLGSSRPSSRSSAPSASTELPVTTVRGFV